MKENKISGKVLIPTIILIIILITGIVLFGITRPNNTDKFNRKTTIVEPYIEVSVDSSNKTIEEVAKDLNIAIHTKEIILYLDGKEIDRVPVGGLEIETNVEEAIERSKEMNDKIKGFAKLKPQEIQTTVSFSTTKDSISRITGNLNCLKNQNIDSDAHLTTKDYEMIIESGESGLVISKDKLDEFLTKEFNLGHFEVTLDDANIYDNPEKTNTNKALTQKADIFNKAVNTEITYIFAEQTLTIPKATIFEWISLSDAGKIVFDDEKMEEYVRELSKKYNTIEMNRKFKTSNEEIITIPYANYGWMIDAEKEMEELKSNITKGGSYSREPIWEATGWEEYKNVDSNDFGDSYLEISLDAKTFWLYINGNLIVTSNINHGNDASPKGAYMIIEKKRETSLKGNNEKECGIPDYSIYLDKEYPIHDIENIEEIEFTKGCIQVSKSDSKIIYDNTDVNFPVIIY